MDLDLTCVRSFLVLVDEGHHGRAAKRLHLTPSALTKRIQRLQRQVDTTLIDSSDRADGLLLTAAGRRFIGPARTVLADAAAAQRAVATSTAGRADVVLGIPAGPGRLVHDLDVRKTGRTLQTAYPRLRFSWRPVPFPALTTALIDGDVDVLFTAGAVQHRQVESVPAELRSLRRVGLVSQRHPLAGAGELDVAEFADLPLLFNPTVPRETMALFYLADVRPRGEARLVVSKARDWAGVIRESSLRDVAVVGPSLFIELLPPGLHTIELTSAPELVYHLAYRRADCRGPVQALVRLLARTQSQH